jgi:type I restriction enzyme S subunit
MSRYKAYSAYRDSGIVWLGSVPAHWVPKRFKQVLADKKKTFNPSLEAGSISFGRVIFKDSDNLSQDTKDSYQEVLSGEYLVNPLNLNYDVLSLRTALSEIDVVVSTGYIVLKSTGVLMPRYIRWLLHEFDVSHMKTLGAGVRQTINYADIGNSYFCAPTQVEQDAISAFLDHETAKIDALIEKQQRLIELLKEKRQAVISHAVTKGLNPNAPMKDSGVEWLGEVPAHWELLKGGYIGKLFGSEAVSDDEVISEGEFPFIKVSSLGTEGIEISNFDFYVSTPASSRVSFNCDYLVFPKRGAAIFTNKVNYVDVASAIDPNLMGWKINEKAKPAYIAHLLKLRGLGDIADVSTVPQINNKHIEPMKLPVPPVNEQMQILSYLNDELTIFDSLSEKVQAAIALAQERRTALISAAVTGKIDVRDWQAAA